MKVLETFFSKQFKKDIKLMKKRGKALARLKKVIEQLVNKKSLDPKYWDHALTGNYIKHRECHIESDWLLIYRITSNTLRLERTGTHSDLFKI